MRGKKFWGWALLAVCLFFSHRIFQTYFERPDLTVIGHINIADGLGRQAAELIETFRDELKVGLKPSRPVTKKSLPTEFQKIYKHRSSPWGKVVIFEDMLWAPDLNYYRKIGDCDPDSIKLAYSMWESTKLPAEWVMILNEHFDAVLVPSRFLIEVYQKSGVNIPIFELPLGLNLKSLSEKSLKDKRGYPMVFGNLSACSDRKNQLLLVQAFAQAFGNSPDVLLRINCRAGEKGVKSAVTREIANLNCNNIVFTQFSLSKDQYLETLGNIDCYVSPSKGEGFSIQPREAMMLGIPVIATNNTGQQEICNSGLVKVIDSPIEEVAIYPWEGCYGYNFNCKIDDLASAMKEMKEQYDHFLNLGQLARNWAAQYDYENLKNRYRSIISPKSVVLGDKNEITEDCIITDSPILYEKYKKSFKLRL